MSTSSPWRPSRGAAVAIGILSIWPIIYMCLFMAFVAMTFLSAAGGGSSASPFPALFRYVMVLHLLTMLMMFALTALYVVHAFRTDLIPNDKKVLWVVVLFLGNLVAFPIYWYLFLWQPLRVDPMPPAAA
ncbi:MAG: hypothetical protein QOH21_740 [Acidobacteriota bacterium]|jgi:hypothetical protein|nr:hypothetical protein [Acidobacteriota bacterium]